VTIVDQVFEMTAAADPRPSPWNPYRWRVGHEAFMEIIEATSPSAPSDALLSLARGSEHFAVMVARQEANREEYLRRARDLWGKDGSQLLGYPVLCDEHFEGIAFEQVKEEAAPPPKG
jgi:hypothetical protein